MPSNLFSSNYIVWRPLFSFHLPSFFKLKKKHELPAHNLPNKNSSNASPEIHRNPNCCASRFPHQRWIWWHLQLPWSWDNTNLSSIPVANHGSAWKKAWQCWHPPCGCSSVIRANQWWRNKVNAAADIWLDTQILPLNKNQGLWLINVGPTVSSHIEHHPLLDFPNLSKVGTKKKTAVGSPHQTLQQDMTWFFDFDLLHLSLVRTCFPSPPKLIYSTKTHFQASLN